MIRRSAPVALVATLILAACGAQSAPRLEDPREILTGSVEAMAEVDSFHFLLALDGTVDAAQTGGSMSLNGTEVEGSIAMDGSAAQIAFAVPAFLGLNGEMRLIGDESFTRTSMTGPMWIRSEVSEDADDPLAQVADPQELLGEVRAFLDEEGVTLEKVGETDCGDGTCYQLALNLSAEMLAGGADGLEAFGDDLTGALGEAGLTIDLLIDVETLYIVEASTGFEDETTGSLSLILSLDGFGDPVEVEAPPADEVTDDAGGFTLP